MTRTVLRDDQWERIKDLLPGKASDCGVTATDNRKFIEAVLWIARTGSPWRDLPESFGNWHRVYVRYNRWSHKGTWSKLFEATADDPDLEYLMVEAALCGFINMEQQKKQQNDQAMGKSRGGLSTKIHAAVDALGSPVRLLLTAGQTSEYAQAEALIEGFAAGYVLADKGYDSGRFVSAIENSQAVPVIHRKVSRDCDKELYKERNLVERFFQKLKNFRRIATRYERLVRNYQAMLSLVSTVI